MTTRRGFLGALLAAAAAPSIVRAGSLMPIAVPYQGLILYADGLHDDGPALNAMFRGERVRFAPSVPAGVRVGAHGFLLSGADFMTSQTLILPAAGNLSLYNCHLIGRGLNYGQPLIKSPPGNRIDSCWLEARG